MKVYEIMNRSVTTCHPSETISTIINKFKLFNISGMPIAEKKRPVGMITYRDISNYLPPPEEMCKEPAEVLKEKFCHACKGNHDERGNFLFSGHPPSTRRHDSW